MAKFSKVVVGVLIASMMVATPVMAADTGDADPGAYVQENAQVDSNGNVTGVSGNVSTSSEGMENPQAVTTTNGNVLYYDANDQQLQEAANTARNGDDVTTQVTDITSGLNITADTASANEALSGFVPWISLFLGVIVFLITVGMTIFSGLDICYIAFPVFRNKCEEHSQRHGGGGRGGSGVKWVSQDAQKAVEQSTSGESDKNPFAIYFGKRLVSYIVLAILLFILLTGNISIFTNIAVNVVKGLMRVLKGLSL